MYCNDCKFWVRNEKEYTNFGECFNEKFEYGPYSLEKSHNNDQLIYWDYESFKAEFSTGENFGCIHFEKVKECQNLKTHSV